MVKDLHLSTFHCAVASWEVIGQNQSLDLFLDVSSEEIGQSLKHCPSVAFSLEVTGQSLSRAFSGPFLPLVIEENHVRVFYLLLSQVFFWHEMNLTMRNTTD